MILAVGERSSPVQEDPKIENQPDAKPLEPADLQSERQATETVTHALAETWPLVELPHIDDERVPEEEDLDALSNPGSSNLGSRLLLEKKHPLAIRWMHWINFPVLFTMIWSGILIYWNDSDNQYRHPHEVYRVGIGSLTLFRFFPPWFYAAIDAPYHVTKALGYHFFFMWIFAINGIAYVLYLLWSREWKFMVPTRSSLTEAIQVTLVDLHLRKDLPPQTKYNGAQRIAYSSVIVMGLGSLLTGLAIYKPTEAHWVTTMLGGYEMARWLHFWLTIAFCAFFLVHVGQVVLAGWNNFRAMVSGYEIRPATEPSIEAERSRL